jgi:hypothetical protein
MKTTPRRKRDLEGRSAASGGNPAEEVGTGSRLAHGGKTIYGARVGILMLDTVFPRVPGDLGNATTWPFPVLFKVVHAATPQRTNAEREAWIIDAFVEAGRELVAEGADGLTTSCGFLSLFQDRLAAQCGVPVAASSLMQVHFVERLLPPGQRVGVITANTKILGAKHLEAAGASPETPVVGAQEIGTAWPPSRIPIDDPKWDMARAEADILDAGDKLVSQHADIGAVVLECTNMPPFARLLSEHLRLPVYDIYSFICWFHAGLAPRDFGHPGSAPREYRER